MFLSTAANESRFDFESNGIQFQVIHFSATERISGLFHLSAALATEVQIETSEIIGATGVLTIHGMDEPRFINGMISRFSRKGLQGRYHLYDIVLRPQVHLLSLRSDCRIFQTMTTPAIVQAVLRRGGIPSDLYTFRLQHKYRVHEYCVQYRETDLAFICRLCAREGIFFFFEHDVQKHCMVFGDSTVNYQPISGPDTIDFNSAGGMKAEKEVIRRFKLQRQVRSNSYTLRDFNFEKPALDLECQDQAPASRNLALYDYPGLYRIPESGSQTASVGLQQALLGREQGVGRGDVVRLTPGFTFTLAGHRFKNHDQEYLVVQSAHHGRQPQVLAEYASKADVDGNSYYNDFEVVPATVTIRPRPLPKPFVQGVQTAVVTGPAGQEIYTDPYGRVKVQFHWDREGEKNEKSSCWLRVSQNWAGAGWGSMLIPRIGQEVIVDFLEGDPDRPIITGRVHHGAHMPPYELPDNKTVTTLKSLSSPGGEGFNELRFEDRKGEEQIFMHAERDMDLRVNNDRRTHIGHDHHLTVSNDFRQQIDGHHHGKVQGNRAEQVDGHHSQTVGGDHQEQVGSNFGLDTAAQIHISAGNTLVMAAGPSLSLKAGAGFITLDSSGVAISGPRINFNSGGSPGSGRGIFTQSPLIPLDAVGAVSGLVEANRAGAAAQVDPVVVQTTTPASHAGTPSRAPEEQLENLYIKFRRAVADTDLPLQFKAGFDIDGPSKMQRSTEKKSQYGTVYYRKIPAGGYQLSFKGFDLDQEPLKPKAKC